MIIKFQYYCPYINGKKTYFFKEIEEFFKEIKYWELAGSTLLEYSFEELYYFERIDPYSAIFCFSFCIKMCSQKKIFALIHDVERWTGWRIMALNFYD